MSCGLFIWRCAGLIFERGFERFEFGKGGVICFDFRRARSHPLGPTTYQSLKPGRWANVHGCTSVCQGANLHSQAGLAVRSTKTRTNWLPSFVDRFGSRQLAQSQRGVAVARSALRGTT